MWLTQDHPITPPLTVSNHIHSVNSYINPRLEYSIYNMLLVNWFIYVVAYMQRKIKTRRNYCCRCKDYQCIGSAESTYNHLNIFILDHKYTHDCNVLKLSIWQI